MNLYNVLFEINRAATCLLKMAGLDYRKIPRFRDCYVEKGNIVVFTRSGGGNRECFAESDDHSECCHTLNDELTYKQNYITDYDDDFDSTYAYFLFRPLDEYKELAAALESNDEPRGVAKFEALIKKLEHI